MSKNFVLILFIFGLWLGLGIFKKKPKEIGTPQTAESDVSHPLAILKY